MAAPPWTNAWNEASPADSDLANTLGTTGRQVKLDIRQRMDWQHVWNQGTSDDGGHRNIVIASAFHTANQESFKASGFSLTGANAQSIIDLAGTWNTSGTPTAIKLNILDSGSNASSLLMDLQVGGVSKFKVDKAGNVITAGSGVGGQVVGVASNTFQSLTTSYADLSGLSVTITPTSASRRVRVQACISLEPFAGGGTFTSADVQVFRGGVSIQTSLQAAWHGENNAGGSGHMSTVTIDVIDSPATTSATVYKVQARMFVGAGGSCGYNNGGAVSSITVSEV